MATRQIGIRELKSHLSECVREVKSGGEIVVTERGHPVARLIPEAVSIEERMERLVRTGKLLWSGQRLRLTKPVVKLRGKKTLSDMIIEDRR